MTDRELLELAAKAAGISSDRFHDRYDHWDKEHAPVLVGRAWNPLTDDGDALRLAVKLDIDVMNVNFREDVTRGQTVMFPIRGGFNVLTQWYDTTAEKMAATRRAIVRAAAEIGRNME